MAQRKKEKESLIVKIKLRQGFANGPFLSGFVFSFFTFFLPRISPNSPPFFFFFKKHENIHVKNISKELLES